MYTILCNVGCTVPVLFAPLHVVISPSPKDESVLELSSNKYQVHITVQPYSRHNVCLLLSRTTGVESKTLYRTSCTRNRGGGVPGQGRQHCSLKEIVNKVTITQKKVCIVKNTCYAVPDILMEGGIVPKRWVLGAFACDHAHRKQN